MSPSRNQRERFSLRPFLLAGLIASCTWIASCTAPLKPVPELNREAAPEEEAVSTPAEPQKPGQITLMSIGDLYQLSQSNAVLIYDVRPKLIYSLGHIPRATSWPKSDFQRDLPKHEGNISSAIKSNMPVVIYCTDLACPDAAIVAKGLAGRGHKVSILQGGYEAWKSAVE